MSTMGGHIPANRWQMALTRMGKHTFSMDLHCLFLHSKRRPKQHGIISLERFQYLRSGRHEGVRINPCKPTPACTKYTKGAPPISEQRNTFTVTAHCDCEKKPCACILLQAPLQTHRVSILTNRYQNNIFHFHCLLTVRQLVFCVSSFLKCYV